MKSDLFVISVSDRQISISFLTYTYLLYNIYLLMIIVAVIYHKHIGFITSQLNDLRSVLK
jgi:hypothetical protein